MCATSALPKGAKAGKGKTLNTLTSLNNTEIDALPNTASSYFCKYLNCTACPATARKKAKGVKKGLGLGFLRETTSTSQV